MNCGTPHLSFINHFVGALIAAVLLSCCFPVRTQAQGVGSSRGLPGANGGVHAIQGKLYSSSGRPIELRLKIRLESPNIPTLSTFNDADGVFRFNGLEAGEYRLTVEGGSTFEDAVEFPSIYREASPGGRVVQLAIFVRVKDTANPLLASAPKEAIALYKKGLEAAKANDTKKAVEHFKSAVEAYPLFAVALSELGTQYLKLGEADKAAEVLHKSLDIAPGEFVPRLNYGFALLNQRKFVEAEEHLRLALKKNDAAPTAHMYLGIALLNQRKFSEAQTELENATKTSTAEVAQAHRYLGGIYWGNREYKRAADELEIYLKLSPKAADAERTKSAIKELRNKQ